METAAFPADQRLEPFVKSHVKFWVKFDSNFNIEKQLKTLVLFQALNG